MGIEKGCGTWEYREPRNTGAMGWDDSAREHGMGMALVRLEEWREHS